MPNTIVGIDVNVNASQATKSVGSLKQELRSAQAEVTALSDKFGATSQQAVQAAKRAAELRDRIGDAKALTDAFNPDAKFKSFSSSLAGVAGGFAAVQGAMGLMGVESDKVEKTLLKVQSAMAISQGLQTLGESIDAFKNLGAVIKSSTIFQKAYQAATIIATTVQRAFGVAVTGTSFAFHALKAAIISTGIGALVVGLGILVNKIIEWTNSTNSQEAAQNRLNGSLAVQDELLKQQLEDLEYVTKSQIARAKTAGKTEAEITAIVKEGQEKRLALLKKGAEDARAVEDSADFAKLDLEKQNEIRKENTQKQRLYLAELAKIQLDEEEQKATAAGKQREKVKEDNAKKHELELEAQKILYDAKESLLTERKQKENAINKEFDEKAKKLKEAGIKDDGSIERARRKQLNDLDDTYKKESKEKEKEFIASINEIRTKTRIEGIKDENEKARELIKSEYDKQRADILNNEKLIGYQKFALIIALRQQENQALEKLDKEQKDKKRQAEIDQKIASFNLDIESNALSYSKQEEAFQKIRDLERQKLIDKKATQGEIDIFDRETKAEEIKRERMVAAAKAEVISGALGAVADAVGRNTVAGKALSVAQATVDTYAGANKALAAYPPPFGAIAAGTVILSGLMNVKKILATKLPKPPGAKGVSDNVSASVAAPISPSAPLINTRTQLDSVTIQRMGAATNRAYVVESDITNSQERIRRINRAARLV